MPKCKGGYYRIKLNTAEYSPGGSDRISVIEYWYSPLGHVRAYKPDGWLRITEGREAAVKQVEQKILKGRGVKRHV